MIRLSLYHHRLVVHQRDSSRWRILHGQDLQAADSRIRRSPCLRDGVKDRLAVGCGSPNDAGRLIRSDE